MEETNPKDTNLEQVVSTPNENGSEALTVTYDSLSTTQKHRYSYLLPLFGDATLPLVLLIDARGRNSWANVNSKINLIQQASHEQMRYFDALFAAFELDVVYTSSEIIGIVGDIRRELNLPPYITRIKSDCERDFFGLFIVQEVWTEEVIDGQIKRKLAGYRPVFQLRPEDQA